MTDEDLWKRVKPYALSDEDFLDRIDERQIKGYGWITLKWIVSGIFGLIVMYAPQKVFEWFNTHYQQIGRK